MALFRTAEDSLQQGHSFVQRGDFANARSKFDEAMQKFMKKGDHFSAAIANAYASIAAMYPNNIENPGVLRYAAQTLRTVGTSNLKVGVRELPAIDVANEAELLAEEVELQVINPMAPGQHRQRAEQLRALAARFQTQFGSRILILPELFRHQQVLGNTKSYPLIAQSEELMGESIVYGDPKAAAEHYQNAYHYWRQAGNAPRADAALNRYREYGQSASCWFCGREAAGYGIHFLGMVTDLTDYLRKKAGDTPLPAFDSTGRNIFACRACHGAVYALADSLAVTRAREVESRLQLEIARLRQELGRVQSQITIPGP